MKRLLAILALLGSAGALLAADNATLITPCGTGCVTVRAKDVGLGVQSPVYILGDTSGNPIYGTAGTANANVLTVQGIASMTKLLVDGSGVTQPVSGTVTANQGGAPWSVSQSGTWTVQQGTPPWAVKGGDVIDANNSSTTPLAGSATFTGTGTDTTGYAGIDVLVFSDQNSAANGFTIQFSSDNTNWDDATVSRFNTGAAPNAGQVLSAPTRSRFYRVVYTNGNTAQTTLRLQAVLRVWPVGGDVTDTSVGFQTHNHALLVQSSLYGNNAGTFTPITATTNHLDVNLASTAITQPVSGTVSATQGTSPWVENLAQIAGSTASTAATGTLKVGIVGNTGAALDSAGQNASSPANELLTACQFNTAPTTITSGNVSPVQCDNGGKLLVNTGTVTVTGTVTANAGTGTLSTNVAQFGGTNVSTGTGAGGAGIPRVTVSQDSKVQPWDGTNTETVKASGTNAATTDTALVVAPSPNPSTLCTSVKAVNQTGSTDLVTSTNKLHICSIVLVSATAQNLSLVEGTGTTCATGAAALIGGTTASVAVAANGGFSAVSDRAWLVTQTTADHVCLLQSGTGNVSGIITYTDHN